MKRNLMLLLAPIALVFALGGVAEAQGKVTKNFWNWNSHKYRRADAESATLGSVGIVRKSFGKAYGYERKETLAKRFLKRKVKITRATRVKGSQVKNFRQFGKFSYMGQSVKETTDMLRKNKLDLVKLELEHGDLARAINSSSKYLSRIRKLHPKGKVRIVTAVWIVVSSKEWIEFQGSVRGSLSYSGATVTGGASSNREAEWTMRKGTIFAFDHAKIKWTKNGKIARFKRDKPNM